MSVAAIVITKDEESNIEACLESLAWADEIIVVDAESTDRTVERATRYTGRVYVRPWPGYGAQKNFAMAQASSDWILIVDADEQVSPDLRQGILDVVKRPHPAAAYSIPRRNFYYGRWIRQAGQYPDRQIRLLRRGAGRYDDRPVHEHLMVQGTIDELHGHLDHYSHPSILSHELKIAQYSSLSAEERIANGNPDAAWYQLAFNPLWTFFKFFVVRRGFTDGMRGLIMSGFSAAHVLLKYVKLWERAHAR